jgi:hypothetical protein
VATTSRPAAQARPSVGTSDRSTSSDRDSHCGANASADPWSEGG